MNAIKLYGKLIRYGMMNRYIGEFLLIYTFLLLDLSFAPLFIVFLFMISPKKEDKIYNFVSILPCRTKDMVKVKYFSEYAPVILAYIISGFILINKGETFSYIYQATIVLVFINIIIPFIKGRGMKEANNPVVVIMVEIVFFLCGAFYLFRMTNNFTMMEDTTLLSVISLGIVFCTLRMSYKRSLKNIYG